MGNKFLEVITASKHREIERSRSVMPEDELRRQAHRRTDQRPFFEKLERPGTSGVNIIAEIKRASPSKGKINADIDPSTVARAYERGGAAAISVLTDTPYFQGSPEDLAQARKVVNLPVLRKDFILSAYQVYQSACMGADAILLIARILPPEELNDLLMLSHDLGMDVMVEIHTHDEIERVSAMDAKLIGINNRDLKTFETDLSIAAGLAASLEEKQVPVAASGISSREDIVAYKKAGIYNFLIGESLMRTPDPEDLLRTFIHADG
jgi:indole-3-glycerol phosphate synthase